MTEYKWLMLDAIIAMNDEQLAEHGGLQGIKDDNALEAALAQPLNKAAYGEPSIFELTAAYCFGIVAGHPFADGNKRMGLLAAYAFLQINGFELTATEGEAFELIIEMAAGGIDQDGAARFFRDHVEPIED